VPVCQRQGNPIILTAETAGAQQNSWFDSSLPHSDNSIASSADGHQLIVGDSYFNFSVSPDTWTAWFRVNLSGLNDAVAGTIMSSADGNTLAVLNGSIYISLPPPTQPFVVSVATNEINGLPIFQLTGQPGYNYVIETSPDLVNWENIAVLANTNGTVSFADPASTNYPQRFYRAVASY
jgi:hypothetical protein